MALVTKSELSVAVTDALINWTFVEIQLAQLFAIVSDIQDAGTLALNRKAHAIFDAIISFDARLAVVDALMAEEGLSPLETETWAKLSSRLGKLYKRRHSLAHFTFSAIIGHEPNKSPPHDHDGWDWGLAPFFTMGSMMRGTSTRLTIEQVRERDLHFHEAHRSLDYMTQKARERRGRQLSNPMPEPPLVARLRALASQSLEERQKQQKSSPPRSETED